MANRYVWSSATGAGTGADWANAHTTLAAAVTAGAAGDVYFVAHDHAAVTGAAITYTFKGTPAAPDKVICVNRLGSVPPVSADITTGASESCGAGAFGITFAGTGASSTPVVYIQGIVFNTGSGAVAGVFTNSTGGNWYFKNCSLRKLGTTTSAASIGFTATSTGSPSNSLILDNTTVQFGAVGDSILMRSGYEFIWKNTASAILGSVPTTLIQSATSSNGSRVLLDGVDLQAMVTGKTVFGGAAAAIHQYRMVNCRLGAGAAIMAAATIPRGCRAEVVVSDSGATSYRNEIYDYAGTLTTETTIVRSGGASDGVTPFSHKIVSTANAKQLTPFEAFQGAIWNSATGSSKTLSIEIVNDGTTLKDTDIWVEAQYLGSAGQPVASTVSSGADVLSAGNNLSTSAVTWTTTGLASPIKQTLSVTFTPQMAGFVRFVVKVGAASKTIYIDPKATLT